MEISQSIARRRPTSCADCGTPVVVVRRYGGRTIQCPRCNPPRLAAVELRAPAPRRRPRRAPLRVAWAWLQLTALRLWRWVAG